MRHLANARLCWRPAQSAYRQRQLGSAGGIALFQAGTSFAPPPGRWSVTRLSWNAWYYDYGGPAVVEFWTRRFHGRDVVFVFMLSGAEDDQYKDRTEIIASVREQ